MTRVLLLACLVACTPAPAGADRSSSSSSASSTTTTTTTTTTSAPSSGAGGAPPGDLEASTSVFAAADVDGDGRVDLVIAATDAAVWVLRGRGDGSFEAPSRRGDLLPDPGHALAVGDLDGDGERDVAVLWGSYLALVRGGLHGSHETLHFRAKGPALAIQDGDGDGCDDAFIVGGNELLRLRGELSGYLAPQAPIALGGEPVSVAAADLDGDGALDLVTANAGSDDLSVLRGDGSGGFLPQTLLRAGTGPVAVSVADLDGDGVLDLVTLDRDGLLSLRGLGGGVFAAPLGAAAPGLSRRDDHLAVCERDGDASREIVVSHREDGSGWLAQFDVDADARATGGALLHDGAVHGVVCADLEGDGRDDLVFAVAGADEELLLRVWLSSS